MTIKKIKVGEKYIQTLVIPLQSKNLIVLRGSRGYCMCGYLNLGAADKFKDTAVKIVGVSNIREALKAKVKAVSCSAKRLGIYKNQPVKDVLKIIA
jgi:uncharacterized protein YunC (DUF1805 family)